MNKDRYPFEEKQRFFPDFGYDSPVETPEVCSNPAFADQRVHRVGWFAVSFDDNGLPGYSIEKRCVSCGRSFKDEDFGRMFKPSPRIASVDKRLNTQTFQL